MQSKVDLLRIYAVGDVIVLNENLPGYALARGVYKRTPFENPTAIERVVSQSLVSASDFCYQVLHPVNSTCIELDRSVPSDSDKRNVIAQ